MTGSLTMVTGLSDRSYGQSSCHVGFEANLRKSAVLLSAVRVDLARLIDVCQLLALANDLFRDRARVSGCRNCGDTQTS